MREGVVNLLKKTLEGYPEVKAAYLFGSVADGFSRKRSDIDIGILLDSTLGKKKAFRVELEIGEELERKAKRKVDLVVLNRAPLALAFRVIKGVLLFDRSPTERSLFQSRIMSLYYDHRRFLRFHHQALYESAKEGTFGLPR